MTVYSQALNEALGNIKTAAVYDSDVGNWLHYSGNYVKNASGVWVPLTLDANGRQQVSVKDSALPAGAATAENQAAIAGYIDGIETLLTALNSKDFATQTTLAAVLAKLIAAPATEARQAAITALLGAITDAAVIDPASTTATLLSLIKGLLKQLQGAGSGAAPVTLSGSIGKQQININRTGDLVCGASAPFEEIVYQTTEPFILDGLVFSSNENGWTQLRIRPYVGGVEKSIADIMNDGSGVLTPSISNMLANGSGIYELLVYDTTNDYYKISLKKTMYFPEGVVIRVVNYRANSTYKVGASLWGRLCD